MKAKILVLSLIGTVILPSCSNVVSYEEFKSKHDEMTSKLSTSFDTLKCVYSISYSNDEEWGKSSSTYYIDDVNSYMRRDFSYMSSLSTGGIGENGSEWLFEEDGDWHHLISYKNPDMNLIGDYGYIEFEELITDAKSDMIFTNALLNAIDEETIYVFEIEQTNDNDITFKLSEGKSFYSIRYLNNKIAHFTLKSVNKGDEQIISTIYEYDVEINHDELDLNDFNAN